MLKNTLFFSLALIFIFSVNLNSQQCEVITKNINFETANSLTFDVYIKNTGTSSFVYSHGSLAWTYDTAILNGGTPTFSLVAGYSDFPIDAYPPSALLTGPNILRTSSNMPGSNGVVQADESLLLYRFRLQTTAASFSSENFEISWKSSVTPYTRIYSWDAGSELPLEIENLDFSVLAILLVENFDFTGNLTDNGWTAHSGAGTNPVSTTTGLTYTDYPGSGVGNAALLDANGEDVNRTFTAQTSGYVYRSALVNVTAVSDGYFFHLGTGFGYASRLFVRASATPGKINFGISNSSSSAAYGTTDFDLSTTYLVIVKYEVANPGTNDLWVFSTGVPATEIAAGTPEVSTSNGTGQTSVEQVYLRQYSSSQNITVDGIRVAPDWLELFPAAGTPTITVSPTTLSGFTYFVGGGPSSSQSYDLSGSDLTPAISDIVVTSPYSYEVSLNDADFSESLTVGYTGGTLTATPIYVRLKAGLPGGVYDGEIITNEGGGATTQNVTCSGAVIKTEPTNHVTGFAGVLGNPAYYYNNLSWTDATGGTVPDGYLIKRSFTDFASIVDPVDGVPETDTFSKQNIAQGLQAAVFTGFAGSTYYYKIFPYTNSGSNIDYKTDGLVPQFSITNANAPSLPITENFEYPTGSILTDNGWVAHSGAGNSPIQVNASPLTYSGYINSGLGKSVTLIPPSGSAEDVNRAFDSISTGSIYASFMVNVDSATLTGTYFFHLGPENSTFTFRARVFVKKNDIDDNIAFGVSKSSTSAAVYTPFNYSLNTTYLIVVKYTFNTGSTTDDEVNLWINPVLDGIEPASDLTQTDTGTDPTSLAFFALRQGSNGPGLTLGGLRVADTWVPEAGSTTFPLAVTILDGWNMVSVPGNNPAGMGVSTWWPGLTGSVFGYSGGYTIVTTTNPGEGYWMKHVGPTVYNYAAINIVPHTDVPLVTGWNMIGLYENSEPAGGLVTSPPGIIIGSIFGFNGGYVVAATIDAGYAYWVKATGPGVIAGLVPPTGKVVELFKEDWGKITITDATGKSFTLYAVAGEVNLENYEMPPMAPADVFDVRYESNRIAEDLNSEFKAIQMTALEYPITVMVENMDIRLQDETGKLVDAKLKSGEDITISKQLSKLMVTGEVIPDVFALEQNYPNPFNPSTVIEFSLAENVKNAKLTIYNTLGEKVAELVNTSLEAGRYSYQWDASNVATGMYIYELRADKFVSIKKMLLLK
ncbi:MAG: T9SS type A sorting domain-containing protein [Ignavibacteria bacterium]|nr:T9SS type A sorting domain-containing protein [Ignavibacteria bacterium]